MSNFRKPTPEEEKQHNACKKKMKQIIMDDPELSMLEKLKKIYELDLIDKTIKY